jgi:hypothetical protein
LPGLTIWTHANLILLRLLGLAAGQGELDELRKSKLANGLPIAYGGDLRHVRYRKLKLVVG